MSPFPDYPVPVDELQRLRSLERHDLLDHRKDPHLDRLLELATELLDTPIGLISLIDADRQWFIARQGLDLEETPRKMAFCAHAIAGNGVLVVPDALEDPRFNTNPLVLEEPKIRFYAGAPLTSEDGHNLGTLCVIDREPRQPTDRQIRLLERIAELAMREIEMRRQSLHCPITHLLGRRLFLQLGEQELKHARERQVPLSLVVLDIDNFRVINSRSGHQAGDEVLQKVADLCRSHAAAQDLIGRVGDEEFAILLINSTDEQATWLAESVLEGAHHIGVSSFHSEQQIHLSGGVTTMSDTDTDFASLLLRATKASELARVNGRDQIVAMERD